METFTTWLKRGFLVVGFTLLAVLGLLLFVAFAFAFRLLLIAVGVAALLGSLVLSRFSPRFREWFESLGEPQISYKGLHLATDIAVYPSHGWALISPENVAVGVDDLVQAALGPVEAVELPPTGNRVRQGERPLLGAPGRPPSGGYAPISGTVVATNQALLLRPGLINEGPFSRMGRSTSRGRRPGGSAASASGEEGSRLVPP